MAVIDEVRVSTIQIAQSRVARGNTQSWYRQHAHVMELEETSTDDPVLYFDFNDAFASTTATTTQIFDQTSNNNDGQAFGAAWTPSGKFDGAVDFDGVDDYVEIADNSSLDLTTSITVSAWVNSDTNSDYGTIVHRGTTDQVLGNMNFSYNLRQESDATGNQYEFSIKTDSNNRKIVTSSTAPSDGSWHHIVGTYDGSLMNIYVNGLLEATTSTSEVISTSSETLTIGDTGSGGDAFNGTIDDVRIYNYARSAEEVLIDYNAGKSVLLGSGQQFTSTSTIGHWSFDEGAPNDQDPRLLSCYLFNENSGNAIDCTGSGDDGSISGATRVNGVTGESSISTNSALNFDGVNDQVTVTDFGLRGKQKLTYSAWVYVTGGSSDTRGIFYEFENGASARSQFYISSADKVNIDVIPDDAGGRTNCGNEATDTISTNTWHHVVGQVDLSTENVGRMSMACFRLPMTMAQQARLSKIAHQARLTWVIQLLPCRDGLMNCAFTMTS